ncbi:putative ABC transporter permease [Fusibacter bizertensis]
MIIDFILFFALYSFIGWVLETIFASALQRKFINRGFLIGPFTPIYGFGAILIILLLVWISISEQNALITLIKNLLLSTLMVTTLEFITGYLLEKIFHSKWWDYSDNFLNFKGYICFKYSILWGVLAFALIQIVHPFMEQFIYLLPESTKMYIAIFFMVYFIFDSLVSAIGALNLRKVIIHYSDLTLDKYKEKIIKYKRIFLAFPQLLILNANVLKRDVRSILNGRIDKVKDKNKFGFHD